MSASPLVISAATGPVSIAGGSIAWSVASGGGQWLDGYDYGADREEREGVIRREREWSAEVVLGEERPGDAVFLRAAGVVCHVGMVLGSGFMLHTQRSVGAVIEPYYPRGRWARRIEFFRRP